MIVFFIQQRPLLKFIRIFHCLSSSWSVGLSSFRLAVFSPPEVVSFVVCGRSPSKRHRLKVSATSVHHSISGLANSGRWRRIFTLCLTPGGTLGLFERIQVESRPFGVQLQCRSSSAAGRAYGGVIKMEKKSEDQSAGWRLNKLSAALFLLRAHTHADVLLMSGGIE